MKTIAILGIITGVFIILFWVAFFTVGLAPENPPPCYFAYEHAFPLPDILLALLLIASGSLVLNGKPLGKTLSLVAAGALIFLGLLDFSFNIQNGIYASSVMDLILNAFINAWCVAFGLAIIWCGRQAMKQA
ncbi:MAG: hypothetical protein FJZ83_05995 [Chloroflexi bacterium]|nr:hypothetical protein [Chloroflexota bacterium]MBM3183569.1 hypothetical protein [Chloroflexota bacterium]